ncbi:hypothetical protein FQN50_009289 [Emmonsiellopsis sp. PD_5]|nr:hypothetical protein FQN50_009289 [Emmonsiellopsis sp. PD_5]
MSRLKSKPLAPEPEFDASVGDGPEVGGGPGYLLRKTIFLKAPHKLPDEEQGAIPSAGIGRVHTGAQRKPKTTHTTRPLHIVQTRTYPHPDAQATVVLTLQNPNDSARNSPSPSEIRWVHLQARSDLMSFRDLREAVQVVSKTPGLQEHETTLALCLLRDIESTNSKPFAPGNYGRYLIPNVALYDGKYPGLQDGETPFAMFCSFPYFDIQELRKLGTFENGESLYPTKSLLQSYSRLVSSMARDKKQAVRRLASTKTQKAIYLPDLWCVIINRKTVITYSQAPAEGPGSLFGKTIETEDAPNGPISVVYHRYDGEKLYIPITKCKTFVELCQKIKEFDDTFNDELVTGGDERIVGESKWEETIAAEKSRYIVITRPPPYSSSDSELHGDDDPDSDIEIIERRPRSSGSSSPTSSEPPEIIERRPAMLSDSSDDDSASVLEHRKPRWLAYPNPITPDPFADINARHFNVPKPSDDPLFKSPRRAQTIGVKPSVIQQQNYPPDPALYRITPQAERVNTLRGGANQGNLGIRRSFTEVSSMNGANFRPLSNGRPSFLPVNTPNQATPFPHRTSPGNGSHDQVRREDTLNDRENGRLINSPSFDSHASRSPERTSPNPPLSARISRTGSDNSRVSSQNLTRKNIQKLFRDFGLHQAPRPQRRRVKQKDESHQPLQPVSLPLPPIFEWASMDPSTYITPPPSTIPPSSNNVASTTGTNATTSRHPSTRQSRKTGQLLGVQSGSQDYGRNATTTENLLDDAHKRLIEQGFAFYSQIKPSSLEAVESEVEGLKQGWHYAFREPLEQMVEIVQVAKKLLGYFAAPQHPSPVIGKYWGALKLLLRDPPRAWQLAYKVVSEKGAVKYAQHLFILKQTSTFLNKLEGIIQVAASGNQNNISYGIPPALFQVFTHLVMFYVYQGLARVARKGEYAEDISVTGDKCTDTLQDLLADAHQQMLIQRNIMSNRDNVSYAALEPETLLSLIIENMMERPLQIDEAETDITRIYSEYMSQLDVQLQRYPGVKAFGKLRLLREELNIIASALERQYKLVLAYSQLPDEPTDELDDGGADRPSYSTNLRRETVRRTLNSLQQKLDDIRELERRANHMQFLAQQLISISNESKDKAILLFTTVTVIFLPLSFVTSYLGMNVSDIRDVDWSQSLFWIIAIPLTTIIMLIVLWVSWGPRTVKLKKFGWRILGRKRRGDGKEDDYDDYDDYGEEDDDDKGKR